MIVGARFRRAQRGTLLFKKKQKKTYAPIHTQNGVPFGPGRDKRSQKYPQQY